MKQKIKKSNKRCKALFGIDDAIVAAIIGGTLTAAGAIGSSIINAKNQKQLAAEQERKQLRMQNEANAIQAAANQTQALNYYNQQELESLKTGYINSLNSQSSQFKCGGKKRMKKNGGTVTSNLNKLNIYI